MTTQIGFPKSLSNDAPSFSLPEGVVSYENKISPSNLSQIQSPVSTLTASQTNFALPMNSQTIIFDIPCGGNPSLFLDPRYTFLNFRVNYQITNTPSAASITTANLRSNAMSFFSRMWTESNGQILDDINNLDVIQDTVLQTSIPVENRDSLAVLYGFNYESATGNSRNSNQGHFIAPLSGGSLSAASNSYYSYSIPLSLNSIIGQNSTKMLNIGKLNNLRINLTPSTILPINIVTSTATTAAQIQISVDNISLFCQYVDIGMEAYRLLNKSSMQYIYSSTYRCSTNTYPSTVQGNMQYLIGIRGSSVHYLASRFSDSVQSAAGSLNLQFDSKAPPASSICYNISGALKPAWNADLLRNPAQCFMETQKALSMWDSENYKSGLVPSQYFIYLANAGLPSDADKVFTTAGTTSTVENLSQFLFAYSLKKIAKEGILDGYNLSNNSGSTFLQLNTTVGLTNNCTIYNIAKMDIIYILDEAGNIQVRI